MSIIPEESIDIQPQDMMAQLSVREFRNMSFYIENPNQENRMEVKDLPEIVRKIREKLGPFQYGNSEYERKLGLCESRPITSLTNGRKYEG